MTNAEFKEIAAQAVYNTVQYYVGNNDYVWGEIFKDDAFRALSDAEKYYFYTGGGDKIIGELCQKVFDTVENL